MNLIINIFFAFILLTITTHSVAEESIKKLYFQSQKPWVSARWYAIGSFITTNRIQWLGGANTIFQFKNKSCLEKIKYGELKRVDKNSNLEILKNNNWIAIEFNPEKSEEQFELDLADSIFTSGCKMQTTLRFDILGRPRTIRPLLALNPVGNIFYGHELYINVPTKATLSDMQIEVLALMGVLKKPYSSGSQQQIILPAAEARGEWLFSFHKSIGFSFYLFQTLFSKSTVSNENIWFSDWNTGIFYQHYLPILNGLRLRGGINFHQHQADEGNIKSLIEANKVASYLVTHLASHIYFADRWFVGMNLNYAPYLNLAGRGKKQSYLSFNVNSGFRVSDFLSFLLEFQTRYYFIQSFRPEEMYLGQTGIRFEF